MDRNQVSSHAQSYTSHMLTDYISQFIDLCILLGCDYLEPIPKVGPSTALKLIREHKTSGESAGILWKTIQRRNTSVPEDWPYQDARDLFINPDVRAADHPDCDFKWEAPNM